MVANGEGTAGLYLYSATKGWQPRPANSKGRYVGLAPMGRSLDVNASRILGNHMVSA